MIRRREFITLLGGAAAAWPLAARAQQRDRLARIAVWVGGGETDPQGQRRAAALREALLELGWGEGRNIAIEYHWAIIDGEQVRAETAELVARNPDVIVTTGACFHLSARPFLSQHDRTAPIMAHDVERVLADIDADHGDCAVEFLRHGVLLDFGAPGASFACWRGQEHGRTIPLAVIKRTALGLGGLGR